MVSKGAVAALLVAAVVGGTAAVVVLSKKAVAGGPPPPPGTVANLSLTASATTGQTPLTVTFSGTATDAAGGPVANAPIYFFVNGALQSFATPIVTDATGAFSFQFTFTVAGTFAVFVSDNTAGT